MPQTCSRIRFDYKLTKQEFSRARIREDTSFEHFPCCWGFRKRRAAAFLLRKTPIDAEALLYTYWEMLYALASSFDNNSAPA